VASRCCTIISNIANSDQGKFQLGPFFQVLVESLFAVVDNFNSKEKALEAAFDAICSLITIAPDELQPQIEQIVSILLPRLETLLQNDPKDTLKNQVIQTGICWTLQSVPAKLGFDKTKQLADTMMKMYLRICTETSNSSLLEAAFLAVSALATTLGSHFDGYMRVFAPCLMKVLPNYQESNLCIAAIGLVSSMAHATNLKIAPYCDECLSILLQLLQNPGENGEIKPPILLCFGDIALAIGPLFEKFLPLIMESLKQAARATTYAEFDVDVHEFLTQLKESVIITWSCIVQAFAGEKARLILPFVPFMLEFICGIWQNTERKEKILLLKSVELVGDLAKVLGSLIGCELNSDSIVQILDECRDSHDLTLQQTATQTKQIIQCLF